MYRDLIARPALAGLILCAGAAGAVAAKAPALAALQTIEAGQWQFREIGSAAAPKIMCVGDPSTLIQIKHADTACARFVVEDQPRSATISYTCPGTGRGRTTIRVESPRDFHLETQGIAGGAPFDTAYQAHRLGACAAGAH
ncbi:MAG: hypothetical protein B7Y45_12630 [Sphingomonas sp. 28-66-16]|nr:MAG: hypothetical protein B7Y45_12630 [Sphingomonas sp. 28-66-16]